MSWMQDVMDAKKRGWTPPEDRTMSTPSKYIDLYEPMKNDPTFDMTTAERLGAKIALQWLDQNADQVPGRTITASEFDRAVESCATDTYDVPPHTFAHRLGITVVPDPEPTNAELLADDIREVDGGNNLGAGVLAERLASLGWVKAPEVDDD